MKTNPRSLPLLSQFLLVLVLAIGMMTISSCNRWSHSCPRLSPPAYALPLPINNTPVYGHNHSLDMVPVPEVYSIYFDYDQSNIRPDQLDSMQTNVKFLRGNPDMTIMITGHCDERGSIEYNFSLGMKRAAAVRDYLVSNGIAAKRIEIGSKGKEEPVVVGKSEKAYAKNRRVEFQRML